MLANESFIGDSLTMEKNKAIQVGEEIDGVRVVTIDGMPNASGAIYTNEAGVEAVELELVQGEEPQHRYVDSMEEAVEALGEWVADSSL